MIDRERYRVFLKTAMHAPPDGSNADFPQRGCVETALLIC
jgi:hypothetical protein